MDWMKILQEIFEVCIIPLLGILTYYLVNFIKLKSNEIFNRVENQKEKKYLTMLAETVCQCVVATNQTYVESLKKQGQFDWAAQKIAFENTYEAVLKILSDESKTYLEQAVGDLEEYIRNLIEAEVSKNK